MALAAVSAARLRGLVEVSPDATILVGGNGRIVQVNSRAQRMFGYASTELVGLAPQRLMVTRFRPDCVRLLRAVFRDPEARPVGAGWELLGLRRDGTEFPIEISLSPVRAPEGMLVCGAIRDITERPGSELALRERERNLAEFFEQSPLGLIWVSPAGRIERVNRSLSELLGILAPQCLGRRLGDFFADPELAVEALERLARRSALQEFRARLKRADGAIRHILIDADGMWQGREFLYSRWFVRDITERVDLEREILAISEREQQRLGNDLHDDLCQQLSGAEFLSQTLAGQLAGEGRGEARRALEIAALIRHAMDRTRDLARGLSPVRLDEDGLVIALRELADRTGRVFRTPCHFRCDAPLLLSEEAVGIHLYRIAQEAVSNALKHGRPRRIDIGLTVSKGGIVLAVRDNGRGLPITPRGRKGMGLRIMRYRASVLGGSLRVQRRPGGGTAVLCSVKLTPQARAAVCGKED